MMPQGWEWIIIVVLAFLIFGPKKLPELARSIGEGIREFKKSISGATQDDAGVRSVDANGSSQAPDHKQ